MEQTPPRTADRQRRPRSTSPLRQPRVRAGAVVAIAAAIGFLIWAILDTTGGGSSKQKTTAVAVSASGLKTLAGVLNQPIYWVGARSSDTYELTQTPDRRIYVRYLPHGVGVGSKKQYLTVGTYPLSNAYATTKAAAGLKDSVKIRVGGGGVAYYSKRVPKSVYVAYPGSSYQVELFDPSPTSSHRLAASGKVVSVGRAGGTAPRATAVAISEKGLKTLAKALKQPLYWVGSESNVTYELTQTPDGRIYIRYLPQGVKVGSRQRYLTVATYPLKNAYATTLSGASQKTSVKVSVGGGGVAYYGKQVPNSVYVAYPGSNYQIEVYDPSQGRARSLVTGGHVVPVR